MKRIRPEIKERSKASEMEVLSVGYFFEQFQAKKRRYPPSFFCTDKKPKRGRKQEVSFTLYKKIILEYFKMYFFDFYMIQAPLYFPLGGYIKKVRYQKWRAWMPKGKTEKQMNSSDGAIGIFWYLRPSLKMMYMVYLQKLTGKSNRLPQIEKIYKDNFNKDLLPIFKSEIKKGVKNKTMYLCTLT